MSNNKILIIDDDQDILETMGSLMEFEGFEIHAADTVERGIEMIEEISPGLILLDVMFPEKKTRGFEAAGTIKQKHPSVPIFIITAINREYAFDFSSDDIQVDEFINKPIKTDRLVETIKKYIK